MFYSLTGTVIFKDDSSIALSCSGVGFKILTSHTTLGEVANMSGDVTLFTYLNVREDALDLFGFATNEELDAFKMLLSVSGVGPKAALAILSALTPDRFALAVASGDTKAVTAANGVGPKLAQRIILELKDKISGASFISESVGGTVSAVKGAMGVSAASEAVSALVGLGYSQSEATVAVSKLDPSLSVEELIKKALKNMTLRF